MYNKGGHKWAHHVWRHSYIHVLYNLFWLTLWVRIPLGQGVLYTTLCGKVCQGLAASQWFSPDILVSSTNKTDRHDIAEILLKVALNTIPYNLFCFNKGQPLKCRTNVCIYNVCVGKYVLNNVDQAFQLEVPSSL